MNKSGISAILTYTFKEAIRAKWLLVFAVVFFLLAINIPMLVLLGARYIPPDYLSIFLSTLVTLSFPFIPLLALPMGATTVVEEREAGTLQYVLSNPITKGEFLLGRAVGLLLATSAVVFLGFGIASAIVYNVDVLSYRSVVIVMFLAAALNATMLGFALVISVLSRRKATAIGIAIFTWFLFTILSDLGFLSVILNLKWGAWVTLPIVLLNPVESARILAVLVIGAGQTQLGSTGIIVSYYLGDSAPLVLGLGILVWTVVLYAVGFFLFRRQDLV